MHWYTLLQLKRLTTRVKNYFQNDVSTTKGH